MRQRQQLSIVDILCSGQILTGVLIVVLAAFLLLLVAMIIHLVSDVGDEDGGQLAL